MKILISGKPDYDVHGLSDVWLCMCDTDLCNSAFKQTMSAVFTYAFLVFALVIL